MFSIVAGQLGTVAVIAAVLAGVMGSGGAYAALVGGLVAVLPNYYLARRLARRQRGTTPEQALHHIYVGELIKIAFTAAMFVIAIKLLNVDFLIVVLTYIATVAVNWVAFLFADLGESPRTRKAAKS
ncbi:MAG: ATP synthase subunit I [Gammaproteobacteria bacterium]|uniref:ATP synthase subunit I n=1 Tax=Algiphilus sp. TaxID=1872431 RepID=UPI0032ECB42B